MDYNQNSYGKNNLWKWILLYVVIGLVAYGLVYYFFFANKGGYNYNTQGNNYSQTTPVTNNSQELILFSQSLDAADVNQLDDEINRNDADANAF